MNFGAIYLGLRKSWNVVKDLANENIKMIETNNLFEVSMGKVVDEYGNLDEEASKYYTRALAFQNEMNEKLGTNRKELMEYQAMYFSMLKSQGINKDASYLMSESLTKAGYDISSLYNLTVEDAMSKLKSGLAGQVEPLRKIGIDISESSLQKVLNDVGITDRAVQQLTYAEKEVARYIAIVNQAGQAQGDFARTFEQPANQLRIFKNEIAELKQIAGSFIINTFGKLIVYANAVIMVIKELLKSLASLFGYDLDTGGSVVSGLSDGIDDVNGGLDSASQKAKELKKQLMGFDEINNIDPASQTSGGSSGGAGVGGVDQKLLDALKEWDNKMDSIRGKAQEIRDKILDWLGVTDGTYANLKRILEIAKAIGIALLTWKVAKTITDLLKNLGLLSTTQAFQVAFGLTLALSGLYLLWNGTKRLLKGDVNLFSILETMAGGAMSTFGIASFLHGLSKGKITWGKGIVIGFGVTLAVQGFEVLKNGLEEKKISQILGGGIEMITGISVAISGMLPVIKGAKSKIIDLGNSIVNSFKVGKHAIDTGTVGLTGFTSKTVGVVAGIAGITAGSILAYKGMKNLTTGSTKASTAILELAGGFAASTASGAIMGYTLGGPVGAGIGALTGFMITGVSTLISWAINSESATESTINLSERIGKLKENVNEVTAATEQAVKAIENDYNAKIQNAGYSEELAKKLYEVVDANGHVKAGNEELVDYILGELNGALGTNISRNKELISSNGEVIGSHQQLQATINDTIKKYKEEAEQEAYQELYKTYVKERIQLQLDEQEAYKNLEEAIQEYKDNGIANMSDFQIQHNNKYRKIMENVNDAKEAYDEVADKLEQATVREQNSCKLVEESFNTMTTNTDKSMKDFSNIVEKVCDNTGNTAEEALNKFNAIVENTSDNVETNTNETLENIKTAIDNKSPEIQKSFEDTANNSEKLYTKGIDPIDTNTGDEIDSMMTIIKSKNKAANDAANQLARTVEGGVKTLNTTEAGKQAVEGVASGINNNTNSNSLWNAIGNLKDAIIDIIRSKFGIHSPSKVMANLAQYIPLGIAEGIDSKADAVYSSMKKLNEGIMINSKDFAVDTNQYVNYGAISGQIQAQSSISMSSNMLEGIIQAVKEGMKESEVNVHVEATTEEGVIVKKASQGFTEHVRQTGELPFPVPV